MTKRHLRAPRRPSIGPFVMLLLALLFTSACQGSDSSVSAASGTRSQVADEPTAAQEAAPTPVAPVTEGMVWREQILYQGGISMSPAIESGDSVVANASTDAPGPGDIVVFRPPPDMTDSDGPLLKRVVASGGQEIQIRDGDVWVDGVLLDEPYVGQPGETFRRESDAIPGCSGEPDPERCIVPPGFLFLLGDNRSSSIDSRRFGPYSSDTVTGIVTGIIREAEVEASRPWIVRNQGIGMEPTAGGEDLIVVERAIEAPLPGDLVIFERPENVPGPDNLFVKRIVASGGQTVELRDGEVLVDGTVLVEPYVKEQYRTVPSVTASGGSIPGCVEEAGTDVCTVPAGFYFALGDNRAESVDSRRYGPIADDAIRGIVSQILPPEAEEAL